MDLLDAMEVFLQSDDIDDGNRILFCGYVSKRTARQGKWKTAGPTGNCWWEDNQLLDDNDFWIMIDRLRNGKWKVV